MKLKVDANAQETLISHYATTTPSMRDIEYDYDGDAGLLRVADHAIPRRCQIICRWQ